LKEYRLVIGENGKVILPEEMREKLALYKGDVLVCEIDNGSAVLTKQESAEEIQLICKEMDMIYAFSFWLPAEVAYYSTGVKVSCQDPLIEVWGKTREEAIEKFKSAAENM